jgi:eukaryotic-like serine/threonine-protein kinase
VLDERALELRVRGERVELARKPLELLMVFLRHPGEVRDKERLLEAVWPGRIVSDTALTNAIGKLRTALGDDEQRMLKAVYGYGYRFELTPRSETV